MKKTKYTESELIKYFGLSRTEEGKSIGLLTDWLDTTMQPNADEHILIDKLLVTAIKYIDFWNEEELKMNFIASLLNNLVVYESNHYRTFYEREIVAVVDDKQMKVKTDFMIATGKYELAENPYFCFHEYKRKKNADDPAAQVLEAMLIAQAMNKNDKPIYGVYIMGRFWYFMVMDSTRTYSISKPYICTEKDQLLQIIAILRKFKIILETELLD